MKLSKSQFESLAVEQMDLLYRTARCLTRNSERAGDLVQEALLRALRSRDTFELQEHGIGPWLVRILRNVHFTRSERESRQPRSADEATLDSASPAVTETPPFTREQFQQMDEELVQAIHQLPSDYQTVLMLWAVEDFSYKEIAHSVDIPIGTVMSRLHRARQLLLKSLAEYGKDRRLVRD